MSEVARVSLMDVHQSISHLAFAVSEEIKPVNASVSVHWDHLTYLWVEIECREMDKQKVIDRLKHGVLNGPYDYRFSLSYPTGETDRTAWVKVRAYPNMSWDDMKFSRKKGAAA